jgi:putative aminopeptidase FrvX
MTVKLLMRMMEIYGTSGNENEIRKLILKEIRKHVKDVKVDRFGNVIAHKGGAGPKIMLAAHMDEVGLIIRSISEKGNIRCSVIGSLEPVSLIGQRVHMHGKRMVHGIATTPEISDDEGLDELPEIEDMIIETGMDKKELKRNGIDVGAFINLEQKSEMFGRKITGKALDDRVGCYVLLELARRLKKTKADIYYVFTVQEEIGLYGSQTSLYGINPDMAVVVDMTTADDAKEEAHEITKRLGKGPTITVKDEDIISNLCMDGFLKKLGDRLKIPYQIEVNDEGTTDARIISVSKGGIPTTMMGVPVRNMHTTMGLASLKDIGWLIRLLEAFLKKPPLKCVA